MSFTLAEIAGDVRELRISWVLSPSLAVGRMVEIRDCVSAKITISGSLGHRGAVLIEGSRRGREFGAIGTPIKTADAVTLDGPPAFIRPRLIGTDIDAAVIVRLVGRRRPIR
jgi:hypothetical protein